MSVEIPVVADRLLGTTIEVRVRVRDADGEQVVPTALVARVGPRDSTPETVEAVVSGDGLVSFTVEPDAAGPWAFQLNVTAPVQVAVHGLIRVHPPAFGGLDG